eukprot:8207278-Pyramimonas_sp.AAC.1
MSCIGAMSAMHLAIFCKWVVDLSAPAIIPLPPATCSAKARAAAIVDMLGTGWRMCAIALTRASP